MRINTASTLALIIPFFLIGCSTTTNFSSTQNGATVFVENAKRTITPKIDSTVIAKKAPSTSTPRTEKLPSGTFTNYEFKAEHPEFGTLYGKLPLKFNGGYLALDILFFTPAMLVNLRGLYSYYEFDLEKKVVKYKEKETERWAIYESTKEEIDLAKYNFDKFPGQPVSAKTVSESSTPTNETSSQKLPDIQALRKDGGNQ